MIKSDDFLKRNGVCKKACTDIKNTAASLSDALILEQHIFLTKRRRRYKIKTKLKNPTICAHCYDGSSWSISFDFATIWHSPMCFTIHFPYPIVCKISVMSYENQIM